MNFNPSQAIGAFAGVFALGCASLLGGAATTALPTLDVQRINIREPDGTLRMVISNAATAPGIIIDGHEQPHPSRQSAGMLFYNDEGTENGGLIFDGKRDATGAVHSSGSLTFDRYKQDQVVQISAGEDGPDRTSGLTVNDQPNLPMDFPAIERARGLKGAAQFAAFRAAHAGGTQRAFLGRTSEGTSEVVLKDSGGTPRLRLRVNADGGAAIEFLGSNGKVTRMIDGARG